MSSVLTNVSRYFDSEYNGEAERISENRIAHLTVTKCLQHLA